MSNKSVTALAIASPAFALDAFRAQRAGSIEAILAGQAAKLGGATTLDKMNAATVKKGLKELDAEPEIIELMEKKLKKDSSAYVKRGRVWLHVIFAEPEAVAEVEAMTVAVREEVGRAMTGAGAYATEGFVIPKTIAEGRDAATERLTDVLEVAREKSKPVNASVAAMAKNLGIDTKVKVKKETTSSTGNGNQKRITLNAMAENVATKTTALSSWVEPALADGTALVLKFKTQVEREAFEEALTKAQEG